MLQVKWFVAFLLVLCSVSAVAIQNTPATAGAKQAGAALTSRQPVIAESRPSKQAPRAADVNRHGLMAAQHPGLSDPLDQANLPSLGKVHSFPVLAKARFLAPINVHPAELPESRAPQINMRKLLTAKPPDVPAVK